MQTNAIIQQATGPARIITHPASRIAAEFRDRIPKRIALPTTEGVLFVETREIVHCQSHSNYCKIHLAGGDSIFLSKTLKWVAERLPESDFIRIHASYIIAMSRVSMLSKDSIRLDSGCVLPVSRQRSTEVRDRLMRRYRIIPHTNI